MDISMHAVIKAQEGGGCWWSPKKWAMCRLHYSCRSPCTLWSACTSADERASCDGTLLWYIADGCVIIRGIHWPSSAAATQPSGGRGASAGVHQPTAVLFQVHFPGRKRISGQDWNRLCYSCRKTVLLNENMLLVELCHTSTDVLCCFPKT